MAGEEIDIHLQNMQAAASFIASGDGKSAILISEKTTRAQLAEELRHWQQERWGLYGDFPQLEKEILREIEAKKFVISKAKLYNMSTEEVEHFKKQIKSYEQQLKEIRR